ncbi:hypothetical protein HPB49_005042 [Dermacentor silvarum]|uniref:Uncharacterized protein n=1 Tax=Dermacentor silvarum TaxID=543639 RepID=A0ACB8CVH9_DERSI|nr:hypothetical protein HPB49_005042 [Dermacentor silvarum]
MAPGETGGRHRTDADPMANVKAEVRGYDPNRMVWTTVPTTSGQPKPQESFLERRARQRSRTPSKGQPRPNSVSRRTLAPARATLRGRSGEEKEGLETTSPTQTGPDERCRRYQAGGKTRTHHCFPREQHVPRDPRPPWIRCCPIGHHRAEPHAPGDRKCKARYRVPQPPPKAPPPEARTRGKKKKNKSKEKKGQPNTGPPLPT